MVHDRVREYVHKTQTKQGWLAQRMHLSEGALSLMLAGKRKMTADDLELFCAILCVPPEIFVKPKEVNLTA